MLCNGSNSVHFGIDVVNMVIGGFHWGLLHYITTISRIYRGQSKKKKGGNIQFGAVVCWDIPCWCQKPRETGQTGGELVTAPPLALETSPHNRIHKCPGADVINLKHHQRFQRFTFFQIYPDKKFQGQKQNKTKKIPTSGRARPLSISPNILHLTFSHMHAKQREGRKKKKGTGARSNIDSALRSDYFLSQCRRRLQPVFQPVSHSEQWVSAEGCRWMQEALRLADLVYRGLRSSGGKKSLLRCSTGATRAGEVALERNEAPTARAYVGSLAPSAAARACI